jgi:long-chain acyl-CoA synthetase
MARYIKANADRFGTGSALIDERGQTSWRALNSRVNQLIAAFAANNIGPGDTIAIFAGNCREYFEVLTAATHAGIIYVPVNWHFSADELAYIVDDAGCKLLFIEGQFLDRANELQNIERISIRQSKEGFIDYEHYIGEHSNDEPGFECLGGSMFYTSGTTGRPKGVKTSTNGEPIPIEVLPMIAAGITDMLAIQKGGTTLLCGPIYHSGQWVFSFPALIIGSTVVMRHKFNPAETLQLIDDYQVTNVHMVPTQFRRILDLSDSVRHKFDGASLHTVWHGAAPCAPDVKQQMIDWWGPVINEYYGSTEGSIVAMSSTQDWLDKPGTVGKPPPTMEIKIIGENGNEVALGDTGDIYVRSLTGSHFEYHNEPEKTKAAHLAPGLFTFGDIGYLDEDGYLYLSDRKIDMIISGGVNIYPAEIEAVLSTHPAVHDVAVFGIPNKEYGEEVKAVVCLTRDYSPSDSLTDDLIAYCRVQLAGYKAPKSVDYLDVMPRHETGKLYKRLLKDPYWQGYDRKI